MKTYLVTGGAGFIGSNFVQYMLQKYEDVRILNLDKLTYAGNLENLASVKDDPGIPLSTRISATKPRWKKSLPKTPSTMWSISRRKATWIAASGSPRCSSKPTWKGQCAC